MSTRSYRGNRGKNVYEIANFSKGVNATNAAMPPGYLKELVNMNISPDGLSLRPREPYLNYALYLIEEDEFVIFSNQVGVFVSKQFPNWEFIIDFFGKRYGYSKTIEDYRIIDGDTFVDNKTGIRYRLLIVDAYELGTEEGQQAKEFIETITNGDPITVRYDSQAPSWVDKYNRHLVWAETKDGLNIQRALILNDYAKYLDLRVTEHEDDILNNMFYNLKDYEGNTMVIEDFPGGIPAVYRRNINQPPELVNGRPSYILYKFDNIFMGDMLNDLEIGYSFVPYIKINKVNSEFGRYRTEYNPLEKNKMVNHDGVVSLVDIDPYLPVEIVDDISLYIRLNGVLNILEDTPLNINGDIILSLDVKDIFDIDVKLVPLTIRLNGDLNILEDTPLNINGDIILSLDAKDIFDIDVKLVPLTIEVEGTQIIESVEVLALTDNISVTNNVNTFQKTGDKLNFGIDIVGGVTVENAIELVQNNDVIVNLSVDSEVGYFPIKIQINNGEWESYRATNNYVNHYNDVAININYTNPVLSINGVEGIGGFMLGDTVKIDAREWSDKVRVMEHPWDMFEIQGISPNFEIIVGSNSAYIVELNSTLGSNPGDAFLDIGLIKK